jgi:hypothetical protein
MPEFATVSVKEAQLRTASGRQGKFLNEYADYIQRLPQGQAGRLRCVEQEKPLTIRRRLVTAAKTLGINLTIKRSGSDIYFWSDEQGAEQPRQRRSYTRRGRAGNHFPPQSFSEPQVVLDATERVYPE